jgi:hypothetical protein
MQSLHRQADRLDRTVCARANDLEQGIHGRQRLALEDRPDRLGLLAGQAERLAMVRLTIRLPSRTDSRSRIAGRELRFGTMSMYMVHVYRKRQFTTSIWPHITWVHFCPENGLSPQQRAAHQSVTTQMRMIRGGTSD